jgi:hypothetical protein
VIVGICLPGKLADDSIDETPGRASLAQETDLVISKSGVPEFIDGLPR